MLEVQIEKGDEVLTKGVEDALFAFQRFVFGNIQKSGVNGALALRGGDDRAGGEEDKILVYHPADGWGSLPQDRFVKRQRFGIIACQVIICCLSRIHMQPGDTLLLLSDGVSQKDAPKWAKLSSTTPPGALASTCGCILPACIIVTVIAKLYLKYRNMAVLQSVLGSLRPAVVAMIASSGVLILVSAFWGGGAVTLGGIRWTMVAIFILSYVLLRKTKLSPIAVMVLAGCVNLLISFIP